VSSVFVAKKRENLHCRREINQAKTIPQVRDPATYAADFRVGIPKH
jgi:hypothetical protein